ncbi:MAG: glycosyltransferase family 2 protein [Ignavibacteria bacterium]
MSLGISYIIVNFNTGRLLEQCVRSLLEFENYTDIEIIVIDNASSDESKGIIERLSKEFKCVKSFYLDYRVSFSEANNIGIDNSNGEYIVILNPDIIWREAIVEKLVNKLQTSENIVAISPLLIGEDGKFQSSYFQKYPSVLQFLLFYSIFSKFFNRSFWLLNRYLQNQEIENFPDEVVIVEQLPCAFILMRKETFLKVGKLDPNYKLFFEDVDLSYRINKVARLAVYTGSKVIHLGGASMSGYNNYWLYGRFLLSMIYFFSKNYTRTRTLALKILIVINSSLILLVETFKRIVGKQNEYRFKKHKYLLSELRKGF